MRETADVCIVGGGVVGLFCGLELANAGMNVRIVDKLYHGSSRFNIGDVLLHAHNDKLIDFMKFTHTAWEYAAKDYGADMGFEERGAAFLALTETEATGLQAEVVAAKANGEDVEWVSGAADLAALFGVDVPPTVLGAKITKKDGIIDTKLAINALRGALIRKGVRIWGSDLVTELLMDGDRVIGVRTAAGDVCEAKYVLVTAGVWSNYVLGKAGIYVPMRPARSHLLSLSPNGKMPRQLLHYAAHTGEFLLKYTRTGQVLASYTGRYDQAQATWRTTVDHEAVQWTQDMLPQFASGLHFATLQDVRTVTLAITPDEVPVVGKVPGVEGLITAIGCNGRSYAYAAGIAKLVQDMVEEKDTEIDISFMRPDRFAGWDKGNLPTHLAGKPVEEEEGFVRHAEEAETTLISGNLPEPDAEVTLHSGDLPPADAESTLHTGALPQADAEATLHSGDLPEPDAEATLHSGNLPEKKPEASLDLGDLPLQLEEDAIVQSGDLPEQEQMRLQDEAAGGLHISEDDAQFKQEQTGGLTAVVENAHLAEETEGGLHVAAEESRFVVEGGSALGQKEKEDTAWQAEASGGLQVEEDAAQMVRSAADENWQAPAAQKPSYVSDVDDAAWRTQQKEKASRTAFVADDTAPSHAAHAKQVEEKRAGQFVVDEPSATAGAKQVAPQLVVENADVDENTRRKQWEERHSSKLIVEDVASAQEPIAADPVPDMENHSSDQELSENAALHNEPEQPVAAVTETPLADEPATPAEAEVDALLDEHEMRKIKYQEQLQHEEAEWSQKAEVARKKIEQAKHASKAENTAEESSQRIQAAKIAARQKAEEEERRKREEARRQIEMAKKAAREPQK